MIKYIYRLELGETIKDLREQKNLTQASLAKLLNISPSIIGMWEQNRRSPDNDALKKIADFFNISVDYPLDRTGVLDLNIQPRKNDLTQQLAVKLIEKLEKDGYKITEEYLPNLILASKITLAQNKKNQDD